MKRSSPHRWGRQTRINEQAREMGELSARTLRRLTARQNRQNPAQKPSRYAELHCLSNFSFQRGASSAEELFAQAKKLGYAALAITDECSLAGIVRAYEASNETGVKLIVGTEVQLADGPKLVLLARNHEGYSEICRLITTGRRCSAKGEYRLTRTDAERLGDDVVVLWTPGPLSKLAAEKVEDDAKWISQHFPAHAWLAVELHCGSDDAAELDRLRNLGRRHALPLVASGDVHMHVRGRRALQDVMTAIRIGCTVADAGHALFPNGERHLRRIRTLENVYPAELLEETLRVAERCTFHLGSLKYEYPHEIVPAGHRDATAYLRHITYEGAKERFPAGLSSKLRRTLERELALIEAKKYEPFFLTVFDIVKWAREQKPPILCQGRGSSANSAVCYCLGITAVSPEETRLLFERFLSEERNEPPDIDVDFEHERREEVLQYVFNKYGRHRAALAATVICYRGKSAVRDVGRALGLSEDALDQISGIFTRIPSGKALDAAIRERGLDPDSRTLKQLAALAAEIEGFPRHLSQHVGGFVISERALHELVPIENAAMPDRTIIQWDKDDLESLALLKVDCLALGMLTCLRKCFDLLRQHEAIDLQLYQVPKDDPQTYRMIQQADTVGVFQIESRAQMSMLPRLKPEKFYDLVVEVAIVRPGPIQGQMVHPYLTRRKNPDAVEYPQSSFERASGTRNSRVEEVLGRTLGVPIFQEQVMELLQVVANFTPGQADSLRRSMAAWRRKGGLEKFHDLIYDGMKANGYSQEFFEQIYQQIQGFGEYGFPESHSFSFALLAYASSWLKCHHPAAFTCALLNSQPMGFYQPSQLIQDAQRHDVKVLPVDVTVSTWDCTLEPYCRDGKKTLALRLGLRQIRGISQALADRLVDVRDRKPFEDIADMTRRVRIEAAERARLAEAGALRSLSSHRHRARWESAGAELPLPVLADGDIREQSIRLRPPSLHEDVMTDYATQGLSLTLHPLALIRPALARRRVVPARATNQPENHGRPLRCAGLVTVRQHPGTAKGVTFVTLEDETGQINVVVWRRLAERQHRVLVESALLGVDGKFESHEGVHHLIAERLYDYSALLPELTFASRDFH
ncbi:MAG TPA: error-prone DNA polymerase [Rudaea sp.]